MGWLFGKKKAREFSFLDTKTTASGGLVFWVDDIAKVVDEHGAINGEFMDRMMMATIKNLPFYWLTAVATSEPGKTRLKFKCFPCPEGGCEVHIDHPAVTKDETGKITIS